MVAAHALLRASRASQVVSPLVRARCLSTSSLLRKDYVQELYLQSLQSYRAPETADDAHKGVVREFHAPSPPKAPAMFTSDELAKELQSYEDHVPDLAAPGEGDKGKLGPTPQERYAFYETPEKDGLFYGDRGLHSYNEWKAQQDRKAAHSGGQPAAH